MKNVLITGSGGMVGNYINFGTRLSHEELDVTDLKAVMTAFNTYKPSVVIHLAAATDLVRCEREPAYAYLINTVGTYNVALAVRKSGVKLVYVSTSGVFDGTKKNPYTESDAPNPLNIYGHSKYLGELAVCGILDNFLIVRTSWVFGGGKDKDKKFVGKILRQSGEMEIRAVADRRGSPTYAKDLVKAVQSLIKENARGIVHLGGGEATRYDVAYEALALMGSRAKVVPVTAADFTSSYQSGENESMPRSPLMRPWREALKEYIETEWQDAIVTLK